MAKQDKLTSFLLQVVVYSVKALAILMTLVILWSVIDVANILYQLCREEPFLLLGKEHLLLVFGSFLTVLIAIEIFLNIVIYLNKNMFHVPLVVATAVTAVARKIIVLDYTNTNPLVVCGIAATILATGVTYWLVAHREKSEEHN
ncbi:MAG: conserved putative rane protein [Chlamydiia bacterium]|nr:conserved putative rane protein [Chlamydiia bacterium]